MMLCPIDITAVDRGGGRARAFAGVLIGLWLGLTAYVLDGVTLWPLIALVLAAAVLVLLAGWSFGLGPVAARAASTQPLDYSPLLDRGRLGFATPDGCRTMLPGLRIPSTPFMAAVAFEAPEAALCRRRLESAGVAVADLHGMLRVGANDAMGAEMVIHNTASHWPPGAMTAS